MTNWIRIEKRLPLKDAYIIIYNPQYENDEFPGHSCMVSNTTFVICGNALKEGFTHWAEFENHQHQNGLKLKGKFKMSKMLTSKEVVDLIETQYRTQVWNVCMVGEMGDIEGTQYKEIMIGVYDKHNIKYFETMFEDVLTVKEIRYTGRPTLCS